MLFIDFTNDMVSGEPGPNNYWRGNPEDYLILANDLHDLGMQNGVEIILNDLGYANVEKYRVVFKSTENGRILSKTEDGIFLIELDKKYWRQFLIQIFGLSFYECHQYMDWEIFKLNKNDNEYYENTNIIISSEWE